MYLDAYFTAVDGVLSAIRTAQRPAIEQAAEAVAGSLSKQGLWFVMDTGHMLRHEAFTRAGGLLALQPFEYELSVGDPQAVHPRKTERSGEAAASLERRAVSLALDTAPVREGDVMLLNSNSGRTVNVIEVAMQCRERGVVTIGFSSGEQMRNCEAAHPSGKKLFDVADICVDLGGPHGDAVVEVENNEKMCPVSGIAAAYALWAIQAEAVQRLQARGVNPSIYRSVHLGGFAYVEEQQRLYQERGV